TGQTNRPTWLEGGKLFTSGARGDASLLPTACDELLPVDLGDKGQGALAWSRGRAQGERAVYTVLPDARVVAWPLSREAEDLLAWVTRVAGEAFVVRQYTLEGDTTLEWVPLADLGNPEPSAFSVRLPRPAFQRPPRALDLDLDGTTEWLLPGHIWGAQLPSSPVIDPLPDSRRDRVQLACTLGLSLERCGFRLSPALAALAVAESVCEARSGDLPPASEEASAAARAWEAATPTERSPLASGVVDVLLTTGDAAAAARIAALALGDASTRVESARWERLRRACLALTGEPALVLSPDAPGLQATSPLAAFVTRGTPSAIALRSDPQFLPGVSVPTVTRDSEGLKLEATVSLDGAGDASFLVGLFDGSDRLTLGLRWDPDPENPRVTLVCGDDVASLARPHATERLRCRLTLLPATRGEHPWVAELFDGEGTLILRRAGRRPDGVAVAKLAATGRPEKSGPTLAGNTLRVERLAVWGAGLVRGPDTNLLYRAHGAWLQGDGEVAKARYEGGQANGALFYATFADAKLTRVTNGMPPDAELKFFWRHALAINLPKSLAPLAKLGATHLEAWWPAPRGLNQVTADQQNAFSRLQEDCTDDTAWRTLLASLETGIAEADGRDAERVWLLRTRLDIARNRGVEAGLPARVALAEALCLYTPPQVHEAAAVLGELDDSARGRALEDVKSTLEERGRAAEAKALAALCR
ncbi:MAG: hypothetical protein KDD82_19455, partial [Planctomycetes bacterium]|nr:hypothetical protein [Planctomycetota bacterium]